MYEKAVVIIGDARKHASKLTQDMGGPALEDALKAFATAETFLRDWGKALLSGKDDAAQQLHDSGVASLHDVMDKLKEVCDSVVAVSMHSLLCRVPAGR